MLCSIQANSSSGLLSWTLVTLVPTKGPWRKVKFESLTLIDEAVEEQERLLSERHHHSALRRRTSSGNFHSKTSSSSSSHSTLTADQLSKGTKVFVMRNSRKTRCIVTSVNKKNETVDLKVDPDQYAPVAQTCTFTLKIPQYSSLKVAKRQLRRALVEEGMHLD